jgi:hypothetical protein
MLTGSGLSALASRIVGATVVAGAMYAGAPPAFGYRPFDGTDAAVTEPGKAEVELQPAGRLQEGSQSFLVAPGIVINFGLVKGLELVFEGRLLEPLSSSEPPNLTDAGTFLKYIVRPGVLQDKSGPSIATEFGVLYPETAGDSHFGASWAGIISQRWDWGTVHFNVQTQFNREQRADLFVGLIVEGPHTWKVRPVTEVFYEDDVGSAQTISALVGLIWQVSEDLSFDVAVREASLNGHPVNELRAGLTFAFALDRFMRNAKK